MSLFYLKALQGEEPYASWYGLSKPANIEVTVTITEDEDDDYELVKAPACSKSWSACHDCPKSGTLECTYIKELIEEEDDE